MDYFSLLLLSDLTEEQRELADIMGFENYKTFISLFTGGTIYIPAKIDMKKFQQEDLSENQRTMLQLLGKEKYLELVQRFSGLEIYAPLKKNLSISARNRCIKEDHEKGMTYLALAHKYEKTTVWIRKIVSP